MKSLLFTGRVVSADMDPLSCCEQILLAENSVKFKKYPLSLLSVTSDENSLTVDGVTYQLAELPIIISKRGNHVTVYRDIVDEDITITVELRELD